jgi:hypothetical protein
MPGAATDAALHGDDDVAVQALIRLPPVPLSQTPQPVPEVANTV